ncbi:type II secretion system protein [Burkholderia sp. BCC1977]|uniref:type II secretion system protein n=1 Tax=Burkholderia sp. BCC1977 TaxID=2817440 RepID=UPI002ABE7204|nr:type II secretion system protein [Burkholderia sp. BCC1977]
MKRRARPRAQRGVAYFWVLLAVLVIALGLGKLLGHVAKTNQRAREAELLYVGNLYREAIRQYSESTPAGTRPYPDKLDDLLRDPRYPVIRRYLRRHYLDPITRQAFDPIQAPEGGVMGIRSTSIRKPVKVTGFNDDQTGFSAARSYREWAFIYTPDVMTPADR